jgi:multidrug efflux pump subunit AcrA (membrane-fusion protein)
MKFALKIILPILAILIGLIGARAIVKSKPMQVKESVSTVGTLVEVTRLENKTQTSEIIGRGMVEASKKITLASQLPGQVIAIHPDLVAGGLIKAGERLLQIDARDHSMTVQEQQARLESSEQEVILEQGRGAVAQKEWELMGSELNVPINEEAKARALRAPQLKAIKANQKATQSALQRAQLNISKARISAPFNLVVLNENVDVGQVLAPNAPVATLAGTDAFWVTIPLPASELKWLTFPTKEGEKGSIAIVRYDTGTEIIEKKGYLIRRLSELDNVGRMVKVVVEIPDPLALENPSAQPLLLGAQVEVAFEGKTLENVIAIPRKVLRGEQSVWLFRPTAVEPVNTETTQKFSGIYGELEIRDLEIIRKSRDFVYVNQGLSADDLLVSSRLAVPVPGLKLRTNLVK